MSVTPTVVSDQEHAVLYRIGEAARQLRDCAGSLVTAGIQAGIANYHGLPPLTTSLHAVAWPYLVDDMEVAHG